MNSISNMTYDHRNLLLSFRSVRMSSGGITPVPVIYETRYYYDEAGIRIRKLVKKYNGTEINPVYNENDDPYGLLEIVANEFYVRDVSGKEMAIYDGTSLVQWIFWGLD